MNSKTVITYMQPFNAIFKNYCISYGNLLNELIKNAKNMSYRSWISKAGTNSK